MGAGGRLEHDAEKLHDFSGNIMRQNKHLERNRDSDLSHFALEPVMNRFWWFCVD